MNEPVILPELPKSPFFIDEHMSMEWQEFFRSLTARVSGSTTTITMDDISSLLYDVEGSPEINSDDLKKLIASEVFGVSVRQSPRYENIKIVTATYSVLFGDDLILCNSDLDFGVILPPGVKKEIHTIKNIGTGLVTVYPVGLDTIDGEIAQEVNQYDALKIEYVSDNNWGIV